MKMRLPDFLIIGAAKSATQTLYDYLRRHPQVFVSTPKEIEYFSRDENYALGLEWYASHFDAARPDQSCGEASTTYSDYPRFPEAASRIFKTIPACKLIYLMRHPVERAYSFYRQRIRNAQLMGHQLEVTRTFEQSLHDDVSILSASLYMLQIEQYLACFPRESLLFLLMEDLIQYPSQTLTKICQFLGVDPGIDLLQGSVVAVNQASEYDAWFLRSRVTAPLRAVPGLAGAAALLPQSARDRVYNVLKHLPYVETVKEKYLPSPLTAETRQELLGYFLEPNRQLAGFLKRDLSHWSY